MRILIAPDSFKDALSAPLVCEHLRRGLLRTFPAARCQLLPLADGGEGTLDALAVALGGEFVTAPAHDPLFRPIEAAYLWLPDSATAVVEIARASGLELLAPAERDAARTTTLGKGELLAHALDRGARHLVLTVGGSATTDDGLGLAMALGYRFFDEHDRVVPPIGNHLGLVRRIDTTRVHPRLAAATCRVATDVTNPFHGPTGAAHVFAAKKVPTPPPLPSSTRACALSRTCCAPRLASTYKPCRAAARAAALRAEWLASCGPTLSRGPTGCWKRRAPTGYCKPPTC